MARAKKAEVIKATGTAVANIEEELAKEAAEMGKRIQSSEALTIRLKKDKKFQAPTGDVIGETLKCVIVDFVARNSFFDRPYNEKDPGPPGCTAVGKNIDEMQPFANVPNRQSDRCKGCGMNEFETSSNGSGKACKNQRVLAVLGWNNGKIAADDPLWLLTVSPTGLKNFDGFVSSTLKMTGKPPIGVVCEISFDQTTEYQKLQFKALEPNRSLSACFPRRQDAHDLLTREPDFSQYEPLAAPKRGAAGQRGRTLR